MFILTYHYLRTDIFVSASNVLCSSAFCGIVALVNNPQSSRLKWLLVTTELNLADKDKLIFNHLQMDLVFRNY